MICGGDLILDRRNCIVDSCPKTASIIGFVVFGLRLGQNSASLVPYEDPNCSLTASVYGDLMSAGYV